MCLPGFTTICTDSTIDHRRALVLPSPASSSSLPGPYFFDNRRGALLFQVRGRYTQQVIEQIVLSIVLRCRFAKMSVRILTLLAPTGTASC